MPSYFQTHMVGDEARAKHHAERQAHALEMRERQACSFEAPSISVGERIKHGLAVVGLTTGMGLTGMSAGAIASDHFLGTTLGEKFSAKVETLLSSSSLPTDVVETPDAQFFTTAPDTPQL